MVLVSQEMVITFARRVLQRALWRSSGSCLVRKKHIRKIDRICRRLPRPQHNLERYLLNYQGGVNRGREKKKKRGIERERAVRERIWVKKRDPGNSEGERTPHWFYQVLLILLVCLVSRKNRWGSVKFN